MRLSRRLLLLDATIIMGACALATMLSAIFLDDIATLPIFAVAGFVGGVFGTRLSPQQSVAEGVIAAVLCGIVTSIVNSSQGGVRLFSQPDAHAIGWIAGVGVACLIGAILGGRIGQRFARTPPGAILGSIAFAIACLGVGFLSVMLIVAVDALGLGNDVVELVELVTLVANPIVSALLVGISIDRDLRGRDLLVGPLIVGGVLVVASLAIEPAAAGITVFVLLFVIPLTAIFGMIGLALVPPLRRRIGGIERSEIAEARVVDR